MAGAPIAPYPPRKELAISDQSKQRVPDLWTEEDLADAVMEYVTEYPQAMDTIEGIAEWWIMRRQVRVNVEALERALNHLTEKGLLEKTQSGESIRYHRKKVKDEF